jgi:glycosyltransferase involved in cell wall biosynthesis
MRTLKILWLSHFVPYPPKGGCFQRSFNLIKRIGQAHEVSLIAMRHKAATHPAAETQQARAELLRFCRDVEIIDISGTAHGVGLTMTALESLATLTPFNVSVYASRDFRKAINDLVRRTRFDLAHFDTIGLAQYLREVEGIPCVVTHHGAESHMIRRRIALDLNLLRQSFFRFEGRALERYESEMCPQFRTNIVMSNDDKAILSRIAPDASFVTVGNGVDVDYFEPTPPIGGRSLVFAGRLDQYANRDGIQHFMETVWPQLTEQFPDAEIHILGNNPPAALSRLAEQDHRVRVPGFVPDVRPYFRAATAAICPVRDGGGTRLKVLDALAQGRPLVTTTIGCEGLAVVPERDALIADTPPDFVRQIARVFDDGELRMRLAESGRRLVEAHYSWDSLSRLLASQYFDVVGGEGGVFTATTGSGLARD